MLGLTRPSTAVAGRSLRGTVAVTVCDLPQEAVPSFHCTLAREDRVYLSRRLLRLHRDTCNRRVEHNVVLMFEDIGVLHCALAI